MSINEVRYLPECGSTTPTENGVSCTLPTSPAMNFFSPSTAKSMA